MFDNIGGKIKTAAIWFCALGICACALIGIILLVSEKSLFGLLIAAIGALLSWVGSFTLYGFGELIDRVISIDEKMTAMSSDAPNRNSDD